MVRVDTVYQKVLALANKEQRGYITPQDFNLFANQAQLEIFEQYFYDTNLARKSQGNDTVYADIDDMLEEKLQIFDAVATDYYNIGDNLYRVHRVELNGVEAEIVNTKDFENYRLGPKLLRPTGDRPIVNLRENSAYCLGTSNTTEAPTRINYFRIPARVNWAYVVINRQAMYNGAAAQDFELHPSEENNLVNKILMLAGIANQQPDIMKAGQGMDMLTKQQQPKT
jgi:hypothetical protein